MYNVYKVYIQYIKYINIASKTWAFINTDIIDHEYGEWFWLVDKNGSHNPKDEKVGMWKCPYHNSRACLQIIS